MSDWPGIPYALPDYDPSGSGWGGIPYSIPGYDPSQSGGMDFNWLQAIPLIGQTFASTYNAVNNPSAPSAYTQPQGAPGSGTEMPPPGSETAPFTMASLTDFSTPYPYVAMAGVVLLVILLKRK